MSGLGWVIAVRVQAIIRVLGKRAVPLCFGLDLNLNLIDRLNVELVVSRVATLILHRVRIIPPGQDGPTAPGDSVEQMLKGIRVGIAGLPTGRDLVVNPFQVPVETPSPDQSFFHLRRGKTVKKRDDDPMRCCNGDCNWRNHLHHGFRHTVLFCQVRDEYVLDSQQWDQRQCCFWSSIKLRLICYVQNGLKTYRQEKFPLPLM